MMLCTALHALAENVNTLVVTMRNGEKLHYVLDQKPMVTYDGDNMIVDSGPMRFNQPRADVGKLMFVELDKGDTFILSESDASTVILTGDYAKAQLVRSLRTEIWNTFCVPFAMTAEQVEATFGSGTLLRRYESCANGQVLKFIAASSIEAGVAYLVKPTKANANPTIDNITVSLNRPNDGTDAAGYGLRGVFFPTSMATDGTQLFVTAEGLLSIPAPTTNVISGLRAYVVLPASSDAKSFSLDLADGKPTAIADLDAAKVRQGEKVYNLNGQCLCTYSGRLQKGVYVVGGRKVVVR